MKSSIADCPDLSELISYAEKPAAALPRAAGVGTCCLPFPCRAGIGGTESRSLDRVPASGLSLHLLPPCVLHYPFLRLDQQSPQNREASALQQIFPQRLRTGAVPGPREALLGKTCVKADSGEGLLTRAGVTPKVGS